MITNALKNKMRSMFMRKAAALDLKIEKQDLTQEFELMLVRALPRAKFDLSENEVRTVNFILKSADNYLISLKRASETQSRKVTLVSLSSSISDEDEGVLEDLVASDRNDFKDQARECLAHISNILPEFLEQYLNLLRKECGKRKVSAESLTQDEIKGLMLKAVRLSTDNLAAYRDCTALINRAFELADLNDGQAA